MPLMFTVHLKKQAQLDLFPMKVVFTGAAMNPDGSNVVRAALQSACAELGMVMQKSVQKDTELLVASRTDTVKAMAAEQRGIKVMSYPDFITKYLGGHVENADHKADAIVDQNPQVGPDGKRLPKPGIAYGDML